MRIGGAALALALFSCSSSPETMARLTPPDGSGRGLKGEYFTGREFNTPRLTRIDRTVNFDWTHRSAFAPEAKEIRTELTLDLPAGAYRAEGLNPVTGKVERTEDVSHAGGMKSLAIPPFTEDIALSLKRK